MEICGECARQEAKVKDTRDTYATAVAARCQTHGDTLMPPFRRGNASSALYGERTGQFQCMTESRVTPGQVYRRRELRRNGGFLLVLLFRKVVLFKPPDQIAAE